MKPRKTRTAFVCQSCGFDSPKWLGRCPSCGAWQTMVEEKKVEPRPGRAGPAARSRPVRLRDVDIAPQPRGASGLVELDRVLGGGLVPGSFLLIGGEPGIGKSTLTLQICSTLAARGEQVLYVSGEESLAQIKLRARRLGVDSGAGFLLAATELDAVLAAVEELKPGLLIVDSIQTVYRSDLTSAPGSVAQVRECAAELLRLAKDSGLTTMLIGHVTKFGAIAGPKTLEHMVDTVLYFEGDRFQQYRILRAVKNRFGPTNEIGVFEMSDQGLREVGNPSEFFLAGRAATNSGTVVVPALEGTRPLLVEVQALATRTYFAMPQRVATGFDVRRLALLLCVLERRAGITTGGQDVFLNVAGGLRIEEPAVDLGIVCAVASSIKDRPLPPDLVLIGEIGLGGEVRSVSQIDARLREAQRLGFKRALVPRRNPGKAPGLELGEVDSVTGALELAGVI